MASNDADKPPKATPEMAPDPDEDDLDDLDDMLDEFAATKISPSQHAPSTSMATTDTSAPAPSSSGPGRPGEESGKATKSPTVSDDTSAEDEDFAAQLEAGMAEMLKDLESNPEMAKQFEELMSQFGAPPAAAGSTAAAAPPPSSSSTTAPKAAPAPTASSSKPAEENFQDTIRRTMERMKASSTSASAASSAPNPGEDDLMAALLKELSAEGGMGGDGDETFSKMLMGMMEQLTNKEILYEPMKELDTKFPPWLAENSGKLEKAEKDRYEEQRSLVREIVDRFESSGYSDGNADDREFIVERMQKMQAAGAPPPDLVGDVNAAEELFNNADTGCPQQ